MLGIYGKHPAFGDFLCFGLSEPPVRGFGDWLSGAMAAVRDHLGAGWADVYDHAPMVRVWIGGHVFGSADLRGVICASRDKVGRRYPLVVLEEGAGQGPPVLEADQQFYVRLEQALAEALAFDPPEAAELAEPFRGLDAASSAEAAAPMVWAANPSPDAAQLMGAVSLADHRSAAGHRSYWWSAGVRPRSSAFLSVQGLPGPEALAWLMTGIATEQLPHDSGQKNDNKQARTEEWGAYADRE